MVIAIHAALLLAFLNLSGKIDPDRTGDVLRVFNIPTTQPSRPKLPQPLVPKSSAKPKAASPPNIASRAVDRVAPIPQIKMPPVNVASPTPDTGIAANEGASPVAGRGTGAGGVGAGNGGGGNGAGTGGNGGAVTPPQLATPVLSGRDFPQDEVRQWPRRTTIFLRLRIDIQGYIAECLIDRGTGVASIDGSICNLAHDRLRFHPALDHGGEAVAGWFGYAQPAPH